jgi:tripartite-type tricarboxylate transporter receptor subunit TctC
MSYRHFIRDLSVGCVAAAFAAGLSAPATAQSDQPFFAGKTIELLVPLSAGGGTDRTARFLAGYLTKYLEGDPSVQVINEPGGGGITGANNWLRNDHSEGVYGLMVGSSTGTAWLVGEPAVEYDLTKLVPIITFPSSRVFFVRKDTGIETVEDLAALEEPIKVGGITASGQSFAGIVGLEFLGLDDKVQHVFGYGSGGEFILAIEQGEVQAMLAAPQAVINHFETPENLRANVTPVWQLGLPDGKGGYAVDEAFPEAPVLVDAYRALQGKEIDQDSDAWKSVETFMTLAGAASFGLWMHPDAPQEAIDAMREAMERAAADPEFVALAEKDLGPYKPVVGDDLKELQNQLNNIEPGSMNWARRLLMDKYDVPDLNLD